MRAPRTGVTVGLIVGWMGTGLASAQVPAPPNDLNSCASIESQAERLACYDKLAGRGAAHPRAPAPVSPTPPRPADTAAVSPPHDGSSSTHAGQGGSTNPSLVPPTGPATRGGPPSEASATTGAPARGTSGAAHTPPASSGSRVPAAAGTPAPDSKEAFGLYNLEHPAAPKSGVAAITGKVSAVSYDPYGKETLSLEDGPVWQLDGSDALLTKGDSVTIKRASLGSYILTTPSGRTHRVRRLR